MRPFYVGFSVAYFVCGMGLIGYVLLREPVLDLRVASGLIFLVGLLCVLLAFRLLNKLHGA